MSNRTGLGNRPVRNNEREDRGIAKRLREHQELQQALRAAGADLETASRLAFNAVTWKETCTSQ